MALLVVTIDPFFMTKSIYPDIISSNNDDYNMKLGLRNYSAFVFNGFTTNLFLNLSVTCYLTVMLFLTSITLKQINTLQENIITMIQSNTLKSNKYIEIKEKIITLKNGSYFSTQLLTFTAGINIVCFMYQIWVSSYNYRINKSIGYKEMIFFDFTLLPLLLKGCHHYYQSYYHYYY